MTDMGEILHRHKRDLARWVLGLFIAAIIAATGARAVATVSNQREHDNGVSALINCLGIEDVKKQIYDTANAGLKRIPTLAYYREHPSELAGALKEAQKTVDRFAPKDCYKLPAVVNAGIPRPHR